MLASTSRIPTIRDPGPLRPVSSTFTTNEHTFSAILTRWDCTSPGSRGSRRSPREHGNDHEAFQQAMTEMHRENQVRPYTACLPALLPMLPGLAIEAPALWSPLHQGLPDKLAGTIVVSDR